MQARPPSTVRTARRRRALLALPAALDSQSAAATRASYVTQSVVDHSAEKAGLSVLFVSYNTTLLITQTTYMDRHAERQSNKAQSR